MLGPYYQVTSYGCERLARLYHVTAILNLQTKQEIEDCQQNLNISEIKQHVAEYHHYEVCDTHENQYEASLMLACKHLTLLID